MTTTPATSKRQNVIWVTHVPRALTEEQNVILRNWFSTIGLVTEMHTNYYILLTGSEACQTGISSMSFRFADAVTQSFETSVDLIQSRNLQWHCDSFGHEFSIEHLSHSENWDDDFQFSIAGPHDNGRNVIIVLKHFPWMWLNFSFVTGVVQSGKKVFSGKSSRLIKRAKINFEKCLWVWYFPIWIPPPRDLGAQTRRNLFIFICHRARHRFSRRGMSMTVRWGQTESTQWRNSSP